MSNQDEKVQTEYSYFGIQSSWGVTKHFGGLRATDELAGLCQIGQGKSVLVVGCGIGLTPLPPGEELWLPGNWSGPLRENDRVVAQAGGT